MFNVVKANNRGIVQSFHRVCFLCCICKGIINVKQGDGYTNSANGLFYHKFQCPNGVKLKEYKKSVKML